MRKLQDIVKSVRTIGNACRKYMYIHIQGFLVYVCNPGVCKRLTSWDNSYDNVNVLKLTFSQGTTLEIDLCMFFIQLILSF